jgi:hypothetical protein
MIKLKRLLFEDRSDDIVKELEVHKKSALDLTNKNWSYPDGFVIKATVANMLHQALVFSNKVFKNTTSEADKVFDQATNQAGLTSKNSKPVEDFDEKITNASDETKSTLDMARQKSQQEFDNIMNKGRNETIAALEKMTSRTYEERKKQRYEFQKKEGLRAIKSTVFGFSDSLNPPKTSPEVDDLIKQAEKILDDHIEVTKKIDTLTEELKNIGKEDIVKKFYSEIFEMENSIYSAGVDKIPEAAREASAKAKQAMIDKQKRYIDKLKSEMNIRTKKYGEDYEKWLSGPQTTPPPIPQSVYDVEKELGPWWNFKG